MSSSARTAGQTFTHSENMSDKFKVKAKKPGHEAKLKSTAVRPDNTNVGRTRNTFKLNILSSELLDGVREHTG
jgi:hypothetical protein